MSPRDLRDKLPLLLDGALDPEETRRMEALLREQPELAADLDALHRARLLLRERRPLEENPGFSTALEARLREDASRAPATPRRTTRMALALGGVAALTLIVAALVQHEDLERYLSRKTEQAQLAYELTLKSEWIMPLFQKTSKDNVLEFAMFGTLPLDDGSKTVIHVDNTQKQGYRIELGKKDTPDARKVTAEDLYREVRATPSQRSILDTLFLFAQRQLEEAVLMDAEEGMVVDPGIGRLNTTLLSGIAQSLEPAQRIRLEQYLQKNAAVYTLAASPPVPPTPPAEVYDRLRRQTRTRTFVMLNGENTRLASLNMDLDSIRMRMTLAPEAVPSLAVRLQEIRKRIGAVHSTGVRIGVRIDDGMHELRRIPTPEMPEETVEAEMITITVDAESFDEQHHNVRVLVRPRAPRPKLPPMPARPGRISVHVSDGEEGEVRIEIDTLIQQSFDAMRELEMEMQSLQPPRPVPPRVTVGDPEHSIAPLPDAGERTIMIAPRAPRSPAPPDTIRKEIIRIRKRAE
ncbi:MAG: hypothetical protein IPP94_08540 [Ignavibacteria bacterium]|nr:hypothetical protein [Ignavibacteria bacterium]